MNPRKLGFPEQILSPRRRVVPGFGLGIIISLFLFVLTLFLLYSSSYHSNSNSFFFFNYNPDSLSFSFPSNSFTHNSDNNTPFSVQSCKNVTQNKTLNTHHSNSNATQGNGTIESKNVAQKKTLNNTHNSNSNATQGNGTIESKNVAQKKTLNNTPNSNSNSTTQGNGTIKSKNVAQKKTLNNTPNSNSNSTTQGNGTIESKNVAQKKTLNNTPNSNSNATTQGNGTFESKNVAQKKNVYSPTSNSNATQRNGTFESKNVAQKKTLNSPTSFNATKGNGWGNSSKRVEITKKSQPAATLDDGGFDDDECDIYDGRWVRDDSKPYYPPGSCPYIDRDFDCFLNKRPEDGYVKWRWQPNHCNIPSLNATHFLEMLRGKSLVFVGDSLNRNMWESLLCILRHSVPNKDRVYEISGRTEFKKEGFYAFRFEDYNCSIDFVNSPFLVRKSSFKRKNGTIETLRLDQMDPTTKMYSDSDVLVFNTGHWWTHEKTSRGEDYYQEGNHVHKRLKVLEAFKRALTTWGQWIDNNVDRNRTLVFFRGYSYSHFSGGQWNSGGQCDGETEPIYNQTHLGNYPKKMRALEYVIQDMKTPVSYINITRLTHYRKDAHPSIYRMEYKTDEERRASIGVQDCSHWCLPGVPDTWNELLYVSLLRMSKKVWSN